MARTGRPPKPIEQKRRTGNPGKRRLPSGAELVALPAIQREAVDLRADELLDEILAEGVPWLSRLDGPALSILRERLEERQGLRDAVLAGTGDRRALRELERQITESLSALGFDPVARARLGLAEVKARSKLEAIRASQEARSAKQTKRLASPVAQQDDAGGTDPR